MGNRKNSLFNSCLELFGFHEPGHIGNLTGIVDQAFGSVSASGFTDRDVDIFVEGDYALTAHSGKKAVIKLSKNNKIGKVIADAVKYKEEIILKRS